MNIMDRYNETAIVPFKVIAARYLECFDGKDAHRQELALKSVLHYIAETPIIDVNDGALERFKRERLAGTGPFLKPAMAGTCNKELTVVSTVLNRACRDWDMLPRVPRIRSVKGPTRQAYPLTWDEQERLFSRFPSRWDKMAWHFAVNTGVRKAELFGLKWSDMVPVPTLGAFVFILNETKNGKSRAVICNSIARQSVNQMRDNGSLFVFPTERGNPKRIHSAGKTFAAAWVKAGLPADPLVRKGVHNLRHTFGHRLRAAQVPEEDRALLLGHSNASLNQHYALPDLERLFEAAERVTEMKDSIVLRSAH